MKKCRTAGWLGIHIAVIILILLFPLQILAAEAPDAVVDPVKKGRIELDYQDDLEGVSPISGAQFTIYRIAKLTKNGGYNPIVKGIGSLSDETDAREILPTVQEAYTEGGSEAFYTAQTRTNDKGQASFEALPLGLYLVEESAPVAFHEPSRPFLVSVPFSQDDQWVYSAHAEPKPVPVGTLVLSKKVKSSNREDLKIGFHFTVKLDGLNDAIPVIYPDGTQGMYESGKTFTLKHGETITFPMIPAGTGYRITEKEADKDGFITSTVDATGTVRHAEVRKASFLNKELPPETGDSYIGVIAVVIAAGALGIGLILMLSARKHAKKGGRKK